LNMLSPKLAVHLLPYMQKTYKQKNKIVRSRYLDKMLFITIFVEGIIHNIIYTNRTYIAKLPRVVKSLTK
jgi:hypothetical protein